MDSFADRPIRSLARSFPALAIVVALAAPCAVSAQDTVIVVRHTHHSGPRLRFGLSGEGGGFAGEVLGGAAGLAPRIGIQANDLVAFYLQAHWLLANIDPGGPTDRIAGFAFHEAMFELTFADHFQIGAGPSVDFIWGCETNGGSTTCGRGDARFGGDFRVAVALGGHGPGRRSGVVFSIDAHPTWLDPNFSTMFLFGIGGELF